MPIDESERSLGDSGTFAGQPKVDRDDVSLSGEATFAGSSKRRAAEMSLGDERTFGDRLDDQETVIDDIEIVDLAARYKTEGTLGRGGMGEVLLALDTRLDRKVAIKRILGEAARSKTAVSRFLTEAKAIAALNHPNVIQIYDYGRAKDGPFLIMEYVDGSSLLDRCRDGALPLDAAVDLACQLCDGLAKAHDLGIVHRDIKPANVLLTKDGLPKLTDFGLAKAEAVDHQMTMTGAVLGTPDFMPPEQRRDAAEVDHRSDLWSLAATVYQMVTGRSPKIIRFDLLPPGLTNVLGKALEESKGDRYQSAREFRDALKTSLVALAPVAAELGEGQCPACGVKNDSSRRFCRGCGESLEAPCLSCTKPMPMWEEICGQCGTKQGPLLEERGGEMAAKQAEAESLLKDYDFEKAALIAITLRDEADSRLKHLVPWANDFVSKISKAHDAQLAQVGERLAEALKHEASFDYPSAIVALEHVPNILRTRSLDGQAETVAAALARLSSKQAEVERLESLVKGRIAARELSGLLPEVEKLRILRPDRGDVQKLCGQLEDRQQKLVAQRDEVLAVARSHLDGHDYESTLAVLRKIDPTVETGELQQLRATANAKLGEIQRLTAAIRQAVAEKRLDGLIPRVEQALVLKPGHADLVKLLESLQAREAKVVAGIEDLVTQSDQAFEACQFEKAVAILQRIPQDRRQASVTDRLEQIEYLAMSRSAVMAGFASLPKIADLAQAEHADLPGLVARGRSYLAQIATHGLLDKAVEQWCSRCETAASKQFAAAEDARRARENFRRIVLGSAAVVAAVALVSVGLFVRSANRRSAVLAALERGEWQAALALDADNVPAILGFARQNLSASPPDIDRAFAELDRAERIDPASPDLKKAWAAVYAARASQQAAGGKLDEAVSDFEKANSLGGDAVLLDAARDAIGRAWLDFGSKAADKADQSAVRGAVDAAKKLGLSPSAVTALEVRALIIEALTLMAKQDTKIACAKAIDAISRNATLATAILRRPTSAALRQAVVAECRNRLGMGLSDGDWDSVLQITAAACAVDGTAPDWVSEAISRHPGGLSAVPVAVLGQLPAATIARLPPETVLALRPLRNSIGIELKFLPAGTFSMGDAGGASAKAAHEVTLTRPFFLSVTEVTNAQWERVMGSVPSEWNDADCPVQQVSWEEAVGFCRRLSELPEERKAGREYRLPTEAEWEYACRAGSATQYSFGDDASQLDEYAWFVDNSGDKTHAVGQKKPNAWGLFDMHGNVWEWCNDWYGEYPKTALTDPQGPSSSSWRVYRGGSWSLNAEHCRSAFRFGNVPSIRNFSLGFRLALSPAQASLPEAGAGR